MKNNNKSRDMKLAIISSLLVFVIILSQVLTKGYSDNLFLGSMLILMMFLGIRDKYKNDK